MTQLMLRSSRRLLSSPLVGAELSSCKKYRYVLRRQVALQGPRVLFIGLNPSTADAFHDDPTVRRCKAFAVAWGFARLEIVNLFALRSPKPTVLRSAGDPVGPENDRWIFESAKAADLIVAAWGNGGSLMSRDAEVLSQLPRVQCLGVTGQGSPKHPLYLRADEAPRPFCPS